MYRVFTIEQPLSQRVKGGFRVFLCKRVQMVSVAGIFIHHKQRHGLRVINFN
ncbi:Uncharacterised protein [Klebsiella oxytoca]|nr:Uncharacterised protein [Klebsiella oxytoca]